MIREPIYFGRFDLFEQGRVRTLFAPNSSPTSREIYYKIKGATGFRKDGFCRLQQRISLPADGAEEDEEAAGCDGGTEECNSEGYLRSRVLHDPVHSQPYRILLMWLNREEDYERKPCCTSRNVYLPWPCEHPGVSGHATDYGDSTFHMSRKWVAVKNDGKIGELFSVDVSMKVRLKGPGSGEHTSEATFWAIRTVGHDEEDLKSNADRRRYYGSTGFTDSEEDSEYDSEES